MVDKKTETDEFTLSAYENVGNADVLNFLASEKIKNGKSVDVKEMLDKAIEELGNYKAPNNPQQNTAAYTEENIANLHKGREDLATLIAATIDPEKLKILHSIQNLTVGTKLWDTTANGGTAIHQPFLGEYKAIAAAADELQRYRQAAVDVPSSNMATKSTGATAATQPSSPTMQPVKISPSK